MSLTTVTLHPNNTWSWTVGQFYLRDDFSNSPTALGEGNNLFTSTILLRLNENWGLRASHRFEARTGTMQEQAYAIYRDMRSWTAALTFAAAQRTAATRTTSRWPSPSRSKPRRATAAAPKSGTPYWLLGG